MNNFSRELWKMYDYVNFLPRLITSIRPVICPLEYLFSIVQHEMGGRIIDIGCGNGMLINLLAKNKLCKNGVGVDISEKSLSVARSVANKNSLELRFIKSIPEEKFSIVLLVDVLHHIPVDEQHDFFIKASDCVDVGGILLIKEMTTESLWRMSMNKFHDLIMARQLIHEIPIEKVEKWGLKSGLKLEESKDYSALWYGHRLRVFRKEKF